MIASFVSKSAAARILGVALDAVARVECWASVALIIFRRGLGLRPRFVSLASFERDAVNVRLDGALSLSGDVVPGERSGFYLVRGSRGWYEVDTMRGTCECPDYVYRSPGRCKHLHVAAAHVEAKRIVSQPAHKILALLN